MKVKACCGCFVGAPHWHGTEIYEPDECYWEDIIAVDAEEWQEGNICITCPACGAELCQRDDHFEALPANDDLYFIRGKLVDEAPEM